MRKTINIAGKTIGENSNAYLVAEIGLNHNHDIDLAKKMIRSAKKNGADAVKFQTFITEKLLSDKSEAFSLFKKLELSKEDFKIISQYCKKIGISFFSTPFCLECIDWLEDIEVPCYKIASMDINYYELISHAAKTDKPIIISTGMSNFGLIEKAVNTIKKTGNDKIIILHTISKYPPKYSEMDLRMIEKLRSIFDYPIGFSDHSPDNTMSVVARVLGAVLFEKHFTLDKNMDGPDHSISLDPDNFSDLKTKLMAVDEGLLEHTIDRPDFSIEQAARRSLYAAKDLKKDTIISKDMIVVIRPGIGISPEYLPIFLNRKLKRDLKKGDLFDLSCI